MRRKNARFDDYEEFKPVVEEATEVHKNNKMRVRKDGLVVAHIGFCFSQGEPDPQRQA